MCSDKLLTIRKITIFVPRSSIDNKNCEPASQPVSQPLYPYLLGSAFLVNFTNFTALKKQLPYVESVFKLLEHVSSLKEIYKLIAFL